MEEITTDEAPGSIGPYSQGIKSGEKIHVSGQGPVDPHTGEIVERDPRTQTRRTLENVDAILNAANQSLDDVVKATVFLSDMSLYDEVNDVYEEMLSEPYPARSAVEVVRLPVDILVEIEVVAEVDS